MNMSDHDDDHELVVQYPTNEKKSIANRIVSTLKTIFHEITFGVGTWGAMRPMFTAVLAGIPFLFLGQHFNKEHAKARDWTLFKFLLHSPLSFGLDFGYSPYLMHGKPQPVLLQVQTKAAIIGQ